MSFLIRGIEEKDLDQLCSLAKQFVLLNLPAERKVLAQKIEKSVASFQGKLPKDQAEYLFAAVDVEKDLLVGTSQVIAKHGTAKAPHLFFKVMQKNRMSQDLGVGFIHKVLRFQEDDDGPTEIGGLLVDRGYRRVPEKVGKQISLIRFLYMAMEPARFEDRVLCELTPPLTEEGRSEFWEALGRRFTGMPYQEADQLSQINKEFIRNLFPEEDIYLSLLDSKARLVMGRVGDSTRPAQHLLESIGFVYLDEVDPFDGGPHFGAPMKDIKIIREHKKIKIKPLAQGPFDKIGLVANVANGKFRAVQTALVEGDELGVPVASAEVLNVKEGDVVTYYVI